MKPTTASAVRTACVHAAFGVAVVAAATPAGAVQPAHLAAGLELVAEIRYAQNHGTIFDADDVPYNSYGGSWESATDPSYIQFVDAQAGLFPANRTKCAPLVTHLLLHSYGWDWSDYPFTDTDGTPNTTTESPDPLRYNALIKQHVGFSQQIVHLADIQPGDILSIDYLDGSHGHTAIIVGVDLASAKAYPNTNTYAIDALENTTFYEVTVLDSTSCANGSNPHSRDTRAFSYGGVDYVLGGVGTGVMGLVVNTSGEIVGYTWSLPTSDYATKKSGWVKGLNDRVNLQSDRELVIGRLPVSGSEQ